MTITSHSFRIHDFASYRGLLVMSGVTDDATGEHTRFELIISP